MILVAFWLGNVQVTFELANLSSPANKTSPLPAIFSIVKTPFSSVSTVPLTLPKT